jgi:hypothetical protein
MPTIETICNQALDEIGYERHIGNIYEGTRAARALLNAWSQTRDALLETVQPDWSRKSANLVLVKSAPNIVNGTAEYPIWATSYPDFPWLYEYAYPDDCITPLQIAAVTLSVPVWRPQPKPFRATTDNRILTNIPNAMLIYVAKITNPDVWHNAFIEMMISALAKKIEAELKPERAMQRKQQEQQNANTSS